MAVLRVKDALRFHEGEPGGVEAIPGQMWWTLYGPVYKFFE